jgi:hypothetical protein
MSRCKKSPEARAEDSILREGSAEPLAGLVLIGTVHGDPRGVTKLDRLFERLRPELIMVELSPFGWAFRRRHARDLCGRLGKHLRWAAARKGMTFSEAMRKPVIRAVFRQIAMPFEYRAAARWAREFGGAVLLVDGHEGSRRGIARWPELISPRNLEILLDAAVSPKSTEAAYRAARRRIYGDPLAETGPAERNAAAYERAGRRERALAREVSAALEILRPRGACYVGGWEHLPTGADPPSLRDLLGVGPSGCLLLDEEPHEDFNPENS